MKSSAISLLYKNGKTLNVVGLLLLLLACCWFVVVAVGLSLLLVCRCC